jgi:hypothetical protein
VEASSLLDNIHAIINNPTAEHTFCVDELILTVQALISLQNILNEETADGLLLYSSSQALCNT